MGECQIKWVEIQSGNGSEDAAAGTFDLSQVSVVSLKCDSLLKR